MITVITGDTVRSRRVERWLARARTLPMLPHLSVSDGPPHGSPWVLPPGLAASPMRRRMGGLHHVKGATDNQDSVAWDPDRRSLSDSRGQHFVSAMVGSYCTHSFDAPQQTDAAVQVS